MPDDLMFYVLQGGKYLQVYDQRFQCEGFVPEWMVIQWDVTKEPDQAQTYCGNNLSELLEDARWWAVNGDKPFSFLGGAQ